MCLLVLLPGLLEGQGNVIMPDSRLLAVPDTTGIPAETYPADSLLSDSLLSDSLSLYTVPVSQEVLDAPVDYTAVDSIEFDLPARKVYLFGKAEVNYLDIELKADFIELDMDRQEVFAKGLPDSTGKIVGQPVFREGSETFECKTLRYNFKTKRGYIEHVISEQEGGFLHSSRTKRFAEGDIHLMDGKYTTCDAEHPHFYVALTKAKVLPKDKIVSGPAYLVVADIPLPAVLPFGFFPNKKGQASGILVPEYGEEVNRGFFLRNGGYYFALSDYFDLRVTGDIYSKGTWGLRMGSSYIKRYRFSGNLDMRFYNNVAGDRLLGDRRQTRDYSVNWSHRQDAKASPTSSFSANVNMSSSSYDRNHSYDTESYLTNTKSSSISYSKRWPGSPFNFSGSFNHSQNSQTGIVDLNLPRMAFNMSRIYPLRSRNRSGPTRWYENIELSYSSKLDNQIRTSDSLMFSPQMFSNMRNGFQHSIPVSTSLRPFNNFNISPNLQYTGVIYTESIKKSWVPDYYDPVQNTVYGKVITDTIPGLRYAHAYLPRVSATFNPRIYGFFQFRNPNWKLQAIRHVMTPSVSFSYTPDMSRYTPVYYDTVQTSDDGTRFQVYSMFDGFIYGTPSLRGKQGNVNFSLNNNLEMKTRSRNDTADAGLTKVKLLESLNMSTSYNIFADSLNWSPVSMSGRTNLLNKVNINFSSAFDMYGVNDRGQRINEWYWDQAGKPLRLTRFSLSLDMSLNSKASSGAGTAPAGSGPALARGAERSGEMPGSEVEEEVEMPVLLPAEYVDFNVPWNLSIRYNFNHSRPSPANRVTTQTLSFSGNISLTPKWKISLSSGYDFESKQVSYTSVNLHRDLHCWEMRLSFIPIGYRRSYSFQINVLSAVLRDLKYEKRKSWYDNPGMF